MITLILLSPLLGFLINGLIGKKLPKAMVGGIACFTVFISFVFSFYSFIQFLDSPEAWRNLQSTLFSWIPLLGIDVALKLDPLSQLMVLVVTGVGFFIHLYSVHYMDHDPGFARYFSYLNLFIFSMLLLVLANNLLLLFIGWEGVGLCSYLLIGFWFEDEEKAMAGKKAFIVNRIGDLAFLIALFLIFATFGTLNIDSLKFAEVSPEQTRAVGLITLLLFIGACGKSAQIPLYVWLPDAMAGPTPVSALIHAATMVTAGVYMVARLHFWYVLAPATMTVVAVTGLVTALFSAAIALFQNDIKKILAYSTISQLGYMFLAVGIGAFSSGIFHLITHAFFKALLFLGAGSVIHALSNEQDIQKMGNLRSKLPLTHLTFLFGTLAIIGIPPFSGFFSKDEILWMAFNRHPLFWLLGLIGAWMTTFYMVRLFTLVFYGSSQPEKKQERSHQPREAPPLMALTLIVLSIFTLLGGLIGVPSVLYKILKIDHFLDVFLKPTFPVSLAANASHHLEYLFMGLTISGTALIAVLTFLLYHRYRETALHWKLKFKALHKIVADKFYVDELYDLLLVRPVNRGADFLLHRCDLKIIDGFINGLAKMNLYGGNRYSVIQNGNLQTYAFVFVLGAFLVMLYYLRGF